MAIITNSVEQKALEEFLAVVPESYRDGNLLMAYYASFAGVFTTDMLYQLLATFNTYQKEEKTFQIHYMAVSDLLLSELCNEIGHELFEMEEGVQKYLQTKPKIFLNQFDFIPTKESLAAFIYQYAQKFYNHPFRKNIKDVLYWKALSLLSPEFTGLKISHALKRFKDNKKISLSEVQLLLKVIELEDELRKTDSLEFEYSRFPSVSDIEDSSIYSKKINHPALLRLYDKHKVLKEDDDDENNDIVYKLRKGDKHALDELYRQCFSTVLSFVTKNAGTSEDAKDITQEVMVVLLKRLESPEFKLTAKISSFIYSVARNIWLHRLRKNKNRGSSEFDQLKPGKLDVATENDVLQKEEFEEKLSIVRNAIKRLDEDSRKIISDVFLKNKSLKEIAKELDFSYSYIRVKRNREMENLRIISKYLTNIKENNFSVSRTELEKSTKLWKNSYLKEQISLLGTFDVKNKLSSAYNKYLDSKKNLLFVIDISGTGKTTSLKNLTLKLSNVLLDTNTIYFFPIFLNSQDFSSTIIEKFNLLSLIERKISQGSKIDLIEEELIAFSKVYPIAVIIDGIDEYLKSEGDYLSFSRGVKIFHNKIPSSKIFISSRNNKITDYLEGDIINFQEESLQNTKTNKFSDLINLLDRKKEREYKTYKKAITSFQLIIQDFFKFKNKPSKQLSILNELCQKITLFFEGKFQRRKPLDKLNIVTSIELYKEANPFDKDSYPEIFPLAHQHYTKSQLFGSSSKTELDHIAGIFKDIANSIKKGSSDKAYFIDINIPKNFGRNISQKLPFRSELITPIINNGKYIIGENDIGFIVVQANIAGEDIFNELLDVALLKGISRGLFQEMTPLINLQTNSQIEDNTKNKINLWKNTLESSSHTNIQKEKVFESAKLFLLNFQKEKKEFYIEVLNLLQRYSLSKSTVVKEEGIRYANEMFSIYKDGIKKGLFIDNGHFSSIKFINIVDVACFLNKLSWCNEFITENLNKIEPKIKKIVYDLASSKLLFEEKRYNAVFEKLNNVNINSKDVNFSTQIRVLKIKSLYEISSTNKSLLDSLDAFFIFLKRNKILADDSKEKGFNFIKLVNQLIRDKLNHGDIKNLSGNKVLSFQWIIEKVNELTLKENNLESIPAFRAALAKIRELNNKGNNRDKGLEERNMIITSYCSKISEGFSKLIGVSCSICIKGIFGNEKEPNNPKVMTLFRDSYNSRKSGQNQIAIPIKENTSLEHILSTIDSKNSYFFENNLPLRKSYKSSSFPLYSNLTLTHRGFGSEYSDAQRLELWSLPYKSTIVVPIKNEYKEDIDSTMLGFFCLDAAEIDVFDEKKHVKLMFTLASRLYNTLKEYLEIIESMSSNDEIDKKSA